MNENGRFSWYVSLLILAALGLLIAGGVMAPDTLPTGLMLGGAVFLSWALQAFRSAARRRLDPRLSERQQDALSQVRPFGDGR